MRPYRLLGRGARQPAGRTDRQLVVGDPAASRAPSLLLRSLPISQQRALSAASRRVVRARHRSTPRCSDPAAVSAQTLRWRTAAVPTLKEMHTRRADGVLRVRAPALPGHYDRYHIYTADTLRAVERRQLLHGASRPPRRC
jgi:hypothetical protein